MWHRQPSQPPGSEVHGQANQPTNHSGCDYYAIRILMYGLDKHLIFRAWIIIIIYQWMNGWMWREEKRKEPISKEHKTNVRLYFYSSIQIRIQWHPRSDIEPLAKLWVPIVLSDWMSLCLSICPSHSGVCLTVNKRSSSARDSQKDIHTKLLIPSPTSKEWASEEEEDVLATKRHRRTKHDHHGGWWGGLKTNLA